MSCEAVASITNNTVRIFIMIFSDAAAMLTLLAFLICNLAKDRTAHPGLVLISAILAILAILAIRPDPRSSALICGRPGFQFWQFWQFRRFWQSLVEFSVAYEPSSCSHHSRWPALRAAFQGQRHCPGAQTQL